MKLLTNNPKFLNYENKKIEIDYHETDYLEILKKARNFIHRNYEIKTHPLYGSIKPNETIYRSIVLEKTDRLDINSVLLISEAIDTFIKFKKNRDIPKWNDRIKEDFSVIDFDLIINAIERIIYV